MPNMTTAALAERAAKPRAKAKPRKTAEMRDLDRIDQLLQESQVRNTELAARLKRLLVRLG